MGASRDPDERPAASHHGVRPFMEGLTGDIWGKVCGSPLCMCVRVCGIMTQHVENESSSSVVAGVCVLGEGGSGGVLRLT